MFKNVLIKIRDIFYNQLQKLEIFKIQQFDIFVRYDNISKHLIYYIIKYDISCLNNPVQKKKKRKGNSQVDEMETSLINFFKKITKKFHYTLLTFPDVPSLSLSKESLQPCRTTSSSNKRIVVELLVIAQLFFVITLLF